MMCTSITTSADLTGSISTSTGWAKLTRGCVSYDHPRQSQQQHAILVDLFGSMQGHLTRVGLELDRRQGMVLAKMIVYAVERADEYEPEPELGSTQ